MNPGYLATDPVEAKQHQPEQREFESKRDHGGNASFAFIVFSVALFLVTRTKLFSLVVLGYFFVGMFAAAILSVPTWLLKIALARRITAVQAVRCRWYWSIFEWSYDFAVTLLLFRIYKSLLL